MKAVLKILIVWMTLLAMPIQGFASATMSCCCPPLSSAAAQIDHDHESIAGGDHTSGTSAHEEHAAPGVRTHDHPASHHHSGKCTACGSCGSCVSMATPFIAVLPASTAPASITVPFDQQILPSVDLALPERPPRA